MTIWKDAFDIGKFWKGARQSESEGIKKVKRNVKELSINERFYTAFMRFYTRPHKEEIMKKAVLKDGDNILDVACGNGYLLGEFSKRARVKKVYSQRSFHYFLKRLDLRTLNRT